MNMWKLWENKRSIIKGSSYTIPLLIMVLLCVFNMIHYCIYDDYIMNYICTGEGTGNPNEHLIFINIVLGYILKLEYLVCPYINWFGLMYVITVLLCVYGIMYVFCHHTKYIYALFVSVTVEILFIIFLTFTSMGYICTAVGVLIGVDSVVMNNIKKRDMFFGGVFLLLGFMFRQDAFCTGLLLLAPIIVFYIKKIHWRKITFPCVLTGCLIIALYVLNTVGYSSDLWKNYNEFNHVRANVYDFPRAEYEENEKQYLELNISKNDYECLNGMIFADKDFFSAEKMGSIFNINELNEKYNLNLLSIVKQMLGMKSNWIFLLVLIVAIICTPREKVKYLLMQGIFVWGLIGALYLRNRALPRIIVPIHVIGILFILYECIKCKKNKKKKICVCIISILFFTLLVRNIPEWMNYGVQNEKNREKYEIVNEFIQENDDTLYLSGVYERADMLYNKPVMLINRNDTIGNWLPLGDWNTYNDKYYEIVKQYNVTYPDRLLIDLAEDGNVKLLTQKEGEIAEGVQNYIEEHTGKKIEVVVDDEIKEAGVVIYNLKYK